jgi:hypothetical protein
MKLKNVNPNDDNVVVSNLINVDFCFFENCKNQVQKQRSYGIFFYEMS